MVSSTLNMGRMTHTPKLERRYTLRLPMVSNFLSMGRTPTMTYTPKLWLRYTLRSLMMSNTLGLGLGHTLRTESSSRDIVPYQRGANYGLVPTNPYTALEPYKVSNAVEQYQPQGILPALPTFVKEDKRPPHDKDKLPWGLPRRDPDVAGAIILINQSQELPEYPNLIVGLTNLLTELIWLIPNDTMRKEEERLQVTTIRIRCEDDEKKDIRLIGYLRGANLTLGDDIWFWGWHRKGSLIARKGYNWTSKAVVTTHTLGLIVPALTLLILLGIGFLLFLAWPSIGSVIDSFVHLVPNKP